MNSFYLNTTYSSWPFVSTVVEIVATIRGADNILELMQTVNKTRYLLLNEQGLMIWYLSIRCGTQSTTYKLPEASNFIP